MKSQPPRTLTPHRHCADGREVDPAARMVCWCVRALTAPAATAVGSRYIRLKQQRNVFDRRPL